MDRQHEKSNTKIPHIVKFERLINLPWTRNMNAALPMDLLLQLISYFNCYAEFLRSNFCFLIPY